MKTKEQMAKEYHDWTWAEMNRDGGEVKYVDNTELAFIKGFDAAIELVLAKLDTMLGDDHYSVTEAIRAIGENSLQS